MSAVISRRDPDEVTPPSHELQVAMALGLMLGQALREQGFDATQRAVYIRRMQEASNAYALFEPADAKLPPAERIAHDQPLLDKLYRERNRRQYATG